VYALLPALLLACGKWICEREAKLFAVLETAAAVDPEVAPLLRDKEQFRYEDQARVARSLRRQRGLRPGLSTRKAGDIIWALASERVYLALCSNAAGGQSTTRHG